jgi:hypothetical protein
VRRIKDEVVEELGKIGVGVTWGAVEREARERLAWKPETPTTPTPTAPELTVKEDSVQSLIREAEALKQMLDEVESKYFTAAGDHSQQRSRGAGAGGSGGGSEEDLRHADGVDMIPPVPPPGVLP